MAYLTGEACLDPTKKLPHGASVIFDNLCCRGVARNAQFVKVCVYSQGEACLAPTLRFASRIKTHTLDDYTSEVGFLSLLYEGRKQPISENKPTLLREQKFDSNF